MPPDSSSSEGRLARACEWLVVLAAALVYVVTAASTVQGGDSGELAAVGSAGGVAHPPGYPLFVLWLRATAWLPSTSPTHRAALATAILGALSVRALQTACRAWGASPISSALASGIFAFTPLAWRLATEPEVFALNTLLAMAVVILSSPKYAHAQADLRVAALGLVAGLGIANHHSIVLLAPLGLFAAIRCVRRSRSWLRASSFGVLALAAGLLPYLYVMIVTRSTPLGQGCISGDARDVGGLVHHFLRSDYGTTRLAVSKSPPEPLAQVLLLGRTMFTSGAGLLLALACVGAGVNLRRRIWSWPHALLGAAFVASGPLIVMRFNLPPRGLTATVVERFHLLPLALASVLGALGVEWLLGVLPKSTRRGLTIIAAVPIVVLLRGAMSRAAVVDAHRPTTERYLRNVLRFVPEHAIVLASNDDAHGGFLYTRCALGRRPDVDVINPNLLLTDWYARQTSARLGFDVEHGVRRPGSDVPALKVTALLAQLIATGRPVFVTDWFAEGVDRKIPSYPVGPLIRLLPSWEDVPQPNIVRAENEDLLGQMELDTTPPPATTWAGVRYGNYARPWYVLANAFEARGQGEEAAMCKLHAAALTPR